MEEDRKTTTVFVVDDDVSCRSFVQSLLESQGYAVVSSESALGALRLLRQGLCKPDLFIIDFSMFGMNGFELIREIRAREDFHQAPILMLTATTKVIKDAVEMDGVEYLAKSSSNQLILDTVKKMLAARGVRSPDPQRPAEASSLPQQQPDAPAPLEIIRLYQDARIDARARAPEQRIAPPQQEKAPALRQSSVGRIIEPVDFSSPKQKRVPPQRQNPEPVHLDMHLQNPAPATAPPPNGSPLRPDSASLLDDGVRDLAAQSAALSEKFLGNGLAPSQSDIESLARQASQKESPAIRFVESLLADAVQRQASDIHIEPQQDALQIRLRIDGALQPLIQLPAAIEPVITARIKILAELNITERRLPQDGSFSRETPDGRKIEFRVSSLPSLHGEKIALRILRSGQMQVKLKSLGLSARNMETIQGVLKASSGLILVTGPTGSGKTSTLYSMLDTLNTPNRNITTVEDPVEYQLQGITQVQVHSEIGYTFERVLRSILRQDPNIILVGEIRDAETGSIALKASVTGHLVLSTIHTNDAPSTVHRLVSMGMPWYLVAAACRLIIAQRLLRMLCPHCKVKGALTQEESCQLTSEEVQQLPQVWRAKGCDRCRRIGYQGRRAIFEVMPVLSHAMKQAILDQATPDKIRELAFMEGMVSLRQEAFSLVAQGETTPEEAFSVLYAA